jgi:mannose-6-phosphate isomerase-like protein (cupin superfamily)/NAD-dependent SIR2 family protein deacetylase
MGAKAGAVTQPSIKQIAADLISRRAAAQCGATVILGAGASVSSGIKAWPALAAAVCEEHDIDFTDNDPISAVADYFGRNNVPYGQRYNILRPHITDMQPSIGYSHLAQLVKDGLISTILTTNWDALVERALVRVIPYERLKVLVRGELPDSVIAGVLGWRGSEPTLVKLHGDTQIRQFMIGNNETRQFERSLRERLEQCVSECTFLVGQSAQDVDIMGLLLSAERKDGALYHVRHGTVPTEIEKLVERAQAQVVQGERQSVLADDVLLNIGDFDAFFTQLDLAVQQQLTSNRRDQLRKAEQSILDKERIGVGYINHARISTMVEEFSFEIRKCAPDLIVFINDPSAPGGMELQRRMVPVLKKQKLHIPTATLRIQGQHGSRTHERGVTSDVSKLPMKNVKKVLLLDAITFSGNTLKIAKESIREQFPDVLVRIGVLVISNQLSQSHGALDDANSDKFIWNTVTDRYEIFFPWGVTQTTSRFSREFEGATGDDRRQVHIEKRPWGAIQILVNEEMTSVRLLTIEAGCKLSFQRHLCRDELFVALDDNIGLEVCAEDLPRDAGEFDERVKSLVLEKDDYVLIPRGVWHRTKASMDRVRLLEVAFGLYDQANDIERRWDDYQRQRRDGKI